MEPCQVAASLGQEAQLEGPEMKTGMKEENTHLKKGWVFYPKERTHFFVCVPFDQGLRAHSENQDINNVSVLTLIACSTNTPAFLLGVGIFI